MTRRPSRRSRRSRSLAGGWGNWSQDLRLVSRCRAFERSHRAPLFGSAGIGEHSPRRARQGSRFASDLPSDDGLDHPGAGHGRSPRVVTGCAIRVRIRPTVRGRARVTRSQWDRTECFPVEYGGTLTVRTTGDCPPVRGACQLAHVDARISHSPRRGMRRALEFSNARVTYRRSGLPSVGSGLPKRCAVMLMACSCKNGSNSIRPEVVTGPA